MTRDRFLAILESILTESVVGEFWIIDGEAIGADGDAGMANHEMVVIQHVFSELIDDLSHTRLAPIADTMNGLDDGDGVDTIAFRCLVNDAIDDWISMGVITPEEGDDIYETMRREIGWPLNKLRVAMGQADDARVYGYENLGWIRVVNNNIQIHGLNRSKLNDMANGLYDCFGDDWVHDTYYLEDMQTGKTYSVPGHVIETQDVSYIRNNTRS